MREVPNISLQRNGYTRARAEDEPRTCLRPLSRGVGRCLITSKDHTSGLSSTSAPNVVRLPYVRCREQIPPIRYNLLISGTNGDISERTLAHPERFMGLVLQSSVAGKAAAVLDGPLYNTEVAVAARPCGVIGPG